MSTDTAPIRVRTPRTWGEFWQATAYGTLATWTVIFYFYPPSAFRAALDSETRAFWLIATFIGCAAALIGLVTRLDLKVELPGLLFALLGPLTYSASQLYYILYGAPPSPDSVHMAVTVASDRYALLVFALVPAELLMTRIWQLFSQARSAKRARLASTLAAAQLVKAGINPHKRGER